MGCGRRSRQPRKGRKTVAQHVSAGYARGALSPLFLLPSPGGAKEPRPENRRSFAPPGLPKDNNKRIRRPRLPSTRVLGYLLAPLRGYSHDAIQGF